MADNRYICRKEQKMNKNLWPSRNLGEVIAFLSNQHEGDVKAIAVAERVGLSPQAISTVLLKDDTSLSWVENIARGYGYRLQLQYTIPTCMQNWREANGAEMFPNAGNLMGIACYAAQFGCSINGLSKKLGMNYRVIERALETGNIKISRLYTIIEKLNIQVKWVWEPIAQTHQFA